VQVDAHDADLHKGQNGAELKQKTKIAVEGCPRHHPKKGKAAATVWIARCPTSAQDVRVRRLGSYDARSRRDRAQVAPARDRARRIGTHADVEKAAPVHRLRIPRQFPWRRVPRTVVAPALSR
jgi:hypothetical protein